MTKKLSPEEIAEMSEDHQCSCKELEQLRADISEAYYLRDKAEGRYCTALGAIEQLHAAVKTAQELAATRLMEIRRLSKREKDLMDVIDSRDRALGFVPLDEVHASEPLPVASRDADHCDYPDCEHHWELVVDWALAAMKKLHESAEPDTDHPEIPAIIPAAAFRAFVDEHARLMRIRASAPQGASRDASSIHDQGFQTEAGCSPADESCASTAPAGNPDDGSKRASPADLVSALQDVVHTDPGPVRAAHAVRDSSSLACRYCPARFMTAWEHEVHEKEHAVRT